MPEMSSNEVTVPPGLNEDHISTWPNIPQVLDEFFPLVEFQVSLVTTMSHYMQSFSSYLLAVAEIHSFSFHPNSVSLTFRILSVQILVMNGMHFKFYSPLISSAALVSSTWAQCNTYVLCYTGELHMGLCSTGYYSKVVMCWLHPGIIGSL